MKKLLSWLLHIIYPTKCIFCGEIIKNTPFRVCDKCIKELPYNENYCKSCGRPLDTVFGRGICGDCAKENKPFERVLVPLIYKDAVRKSIIRFKYNGKKSFSKTYAIFIFTELKNCGCIPDAITYTPIHFLRKMQRGFCQTEAVAKELSKLCGVPLIHLLKKTRYTRKLASLSAKERQKTVKGSFKATGKEKPEGNVLLIDDIITTSATVTECGKVIKKAYGCNLMVATIAATDKLR